MEPLEKLKVWEEILSFSLEKAIKEMEFHIDAITPAEEMFVNTLNKAISEGYQFLVGAYGEVYNEYSRKYAGMGSGESGKKTKRRKKKEW